MQCNPEERQYFLDYKTDLPSPPTSSCLLTPAQSEQENA